MRPTRFFVITLVIALVTGAIDAAMVEWDVLGSRGLAFAPPRTGLFVAVTWIAFVFVVSLALAAIPGLRRFAVAGLLAAGPGLLVISRVELWLRNSVPDHWVVLTLVIAVCCAAVIGQKRIGKTVSRVDSYTVAVAFLAVLLFASGFRHAAARTVRRTTTARRPNILVIVLDTTRYDRLAIMPNLRRFATTAIAFDNAWSPACWTLPSHFALFTGRNDWTARYEPALFQYTYSFSTLAQTLGRVGYATEAIFGNPYLMPGSGLTRGFDASRYSGDCGACRSGLMYLVSRIAVPLGVRNPYCDWMTGSQVAGAAVASIRAAQRPYFIAVNFMDPHAPYYVEPRCRGASEHGYNSAADRAALFYAVKDRLPVTPSAIERVRAQYDRTVRCMDRALGEILDAVGSEPTIIAILSDHGEQFGEHALFDHGNSLYRQLLHVLLFLRAPSLPPRRVAAPVSLTDLDPTLLQLAGIPSRRAALLDATPAWCPSKCDTTFSTADAHYHLIRYPDGREVVYDYANDPDETKPLTTYDVAAVGKLRQAAMASSPRRPGYGSVLRALPYIQ